jgi:hypothetical protein
VWEREGGKERDTVRCIERKREARVHVVSGDRQTDRKTVRHIERERKARIHVVAGDRQTDRETE